MPKELAIGTMGFSLSACAVEASTKASKPRLSQRKFSQARAAPIPRPAPHQRSRSTATNRPAAKPIRRVSQEIRRSVTAAGVDSATLDAIAASRKPPENVAHASIKTNAAEHEQENRLGMEPVVEKITKKSAHDDGGDKHEGQFHGNRSLVGDVFRFLHPRRR